MTRPFAELVGDMDGLVLGTLNDGQADYLSGTGALLAPDLEVIIDKDVERFEVAGGLLDRAVTIAVQRHLLQPLDRKGAFVLGGKTWHIDGIAADDGHLITFFVVP